MATIVSEVRRQGVHNPAQTIRGELKTVPVEVPQSELSLAREPSRVAVPIELVRSKRTAAAAFTLACDTSGLEDKEIYLSVSIDAGYFSNIKKGKATLQADLTARFCDVVGNTIYPEWIAHQVHCTLVLIKSEAERRADAAETRALEAERKLAFATELLIGRAA